MAAVLKPQGRFTLCFRYLLLTVNGGMAVFSVIRHSRDVEVRDVSLHTLQNPLQDLHFRGVTAKVSVVVDGLDLVVTGAA